MNRSTCLVPSLLAAAALLFAVLAVPAVGQDSFFDGVYDLSNLNGANGFVLNGIDPLDGSGNSVSIAGDVNGDGVDDLIIGAYGADGNGISGAGESYVVFGGSGVGAGGVFELDSLNGANGFVLNGIDPSDSSGESVSSAGDVNGDGVGDLIIGAGGGGVSADNTAGESYVVFGGTSVGAGGVFELDSLNGANGFVFNGIDRGNLTGVSVSSAGDVNRDGVGDLIIGARGVSPNGDNVAGQSYLVFGGSALVNTAAGVGGVFELDSLNGANGFVLNGIDLGDLSGESVSSAGDVNGDGVGDLIIGAPDADPNGDNGAGESYVVFGGTSVGAGGVFELDSLNGANGFVLNGIDRYHRSGESVSSAGDVNGDGVGDLIIGASDADPNGIGGAGESYVVFGGTSVGAGGVFELDSLNGANGFVLNGIDPSDSSGESVSSAGDVNGDGVGDLIIGARSADPNGANSAGESYVVFGGTGVGAGGVFELDSLNGVNGFVLNGIDPSDQSGWSVSSAGDVNGDGVGDLIIGAFRAGPNEDSFNGESYVVFGVLGFTWMPLTGGAFDTAGSWLGGAAPTATGGVIVVQPDFGQTITGPTGLVIADRFTLSAGVGTADFVMSGGILQVNETLTIKDGGKLSGTGVVSVSGALNSDGEIDFGAGGLTVGGASIVNNGLIRGVGKIDAVVTNHGDIEAFDQTGMLDFDQAITNSATGLIVVRDSALRFRAGLTNEGGLFIGDGVSDLFADVNNTGTIGIAGSSTLSLVGDLTQNGALNLLAGSKLIVFGELSGAGGATGEGAVEVLGTLSVGNSPAEVSFGGDLLVGGGAETLIELAGTGAGEFDRLVIAGLAAIGGELEVLLLDGYTPVAGDQFEFLTAGGGVAGLFATETMPQLANGLYFDVLYGTNGVQLAVAGVEGDYNFDGTVDAADYTVWRDGLGTTFTVADYEVWRDNFGASAFMPSFSPGLAAATVPEPSSALLLMALVSLTGLRSRR